MKFASQNLRNASQIAKCKPLIRTLASCQFYQFIATCQQVATSLSLSGQFHQVAIGLLKSGLLALVICRLVTTC